MATIKDPIIGIKEQAAKYAPVLENFGKQQHNQNIKTFIDKFSSKVNELTKLDPKTHIEEFKKACSDLQAFVSIAEDNIQQGHESKAQLLIICRDLNTTLKRYQPPVTKPLAPVQQQLPQEKVPATPGPAITFAAKQGRTGVAPTPETTAPARAPETTPNEQPSKPDH